MGGARSRAVSDASKRITSTVPRLLSTFYVYTVPTGCGETSHEMRYYRQCEEITCVSWGSCSIERGSMIAWSMPPGHVHPE